MTELQSSPFYIHGYNKFILDRITLPNSDKYKHKGSGVAIFLDNSYKTATKNYSLSICTADIEILTVSFSVNKIQYHIMGVYRPPNGNFTNFIQEFDKIINQANKHESLLHVIGDFNVNLLNHSTKIATTYLDSVFSNGLLPVISRPTHFQGINPTCIDHMLTNKIDDIITSGIIPYNITHHMPTFSTVNIDHVLAEPKPSRPILYVNETSINGFISDFNDRTTDLVNCDSAEDNFHKFTNIFKEHYDKWFLHEKVKKCNFVHQKSEWITPGLAKSSQMKNKLYQNWRKKRTNGNWTKYIDYKRKYDIIEAKIKYNYFDKKFNACKSNTKKVWGLVNNLLGRKKRNSVLTFTSEDAAHNFNIYFTSIASKLVADNYSPKETTANDNFKSYLGNCEATFVDVEFDICDLKQFISGLNNNKSTYFSPLALKSVSDYISPILLKLYNKCYNEGYFPGELKTAKVVPIFKKKGDKASVKLSSNIYVIYFLQTL